MNKKSALALVLLAALVFVLPHLASAASDNSGSGGIISSIFSLAANGLTSPLTFLFETMILPFAAAMMALAGLVMDTAIQFSINTGYILQFSPAINLGWVIIRDIANILFIFILIYISLGTIIQGAGFRTKDLLKKLIIAALLVNFSMFFTKVIIDVSNTFGLWLYGGIQNTLVANTATAPNGSSSVSLSALIADRLGILKYWASGQSTNQTNPISDGTWSFTNSMVRLIIVLITTYIFAYTAILFLARAVEILILLVFSPIGFVGGLLLQTSKYSKEWWSELSAVATFPVAFLLMLYISLQFINSFGLLTSKLGTTTGQVQIGGFDVMKYFQFFIIIFLLRACLKVAKDNAGEIGSVVGGLAGSLAKFAVNAGIGVASGGSAIAMRSIIGRGAGALAGNAKLQDFASGTRGNSVTQFFAKQGLKGASGISKSSFDMRGSKILKNSIKDATGVDIGKPVLSYDAKKKDIEKKETEFGKLLGKGAEGEKRRQDYGETLKSNIFYTATGSGALAAGVGKGMIEKSQKGYERELINEKKKKLFELRWKNKAAASSLDEKIKGAEKNLNTQREKLSQMKQFGGSKFSELTNQESEVDSLEKELKFLKNQRAALDKDPENNTDIQTLKGEIEEMQKEFKRTEKIEGDEEKGGGKKDKGDGEEGEDKKDKK